jgi:hypothetical protein
VGRPGKADLSFKDKESRLSKIQVNWSKLHDALFNADSDVVENLTMN